MKRSTTSNKPAKRWAKALALLAWLLVWYIASKWIAQEMLLASPVSVAKRLVELVQTASFWQAVGFSLSRVVAGFFLALTVGIVLAVAAWKWHWLEVLLHPFISVVKSAPVASYIILCLLFLPSRKLSICISFLMAMPILYTNVLEGLHSMNPQLLEMAQVYQVPAYKRVVYVYFSQLMPFLISSCSLALGMCWKSGIAAEVIGLPLGSIGENLYQAKIFVDTKTVLAWTVVIITVSFLFEHAFLWLLNRIAAAVERK